ncbi:glycosyltransferase [Vibrio natriegens]|uniref:glycosyltransferase family 4 protein n=1 Tax=Vibrio natriegens TaxID=691 RepID=UPI0022845DB5|nr:glycosyltransferase [Vibrio natriegens]MCY9875218.1 glycosyltransferase [Vibrio natriegens]
MGLFNELFKLVDLDIIESGYPSSGPFVESDREQSLLRMSKQPLKQTQKKILSVDSSIFHSLRKEYDYIVFSSFISLPFLLLIIPAKLLGKKIVVFDEIWKYPTTTKYLYAKPFFKKLVNWFVDGFILSGSKAFDFNNSFFKSSIKRTIAFNTNSNYDTPLEENEREKKILYLGRIVEIKALDSIISALPEVDYTLVVVGSAEEKYLEYCKNLAYKLDVANRVEFLGPCERSETYNYYAKYEYFCLPSKYMPNQSQQLESWGFTVNEALEMGCKVIVSNKVGSSFDLIENGVNGYIFDVNDESDLTNKIKLIDKITSTPKEIRRRLKNKCNYQENAERISDLIKQL